MRNLLQEKTGWKDGWSVVQWALTSKRLGGKKKNDF